MSSNACAKSRSRILFSTIMIHSQNIVLVLLSNCISSADWFFPIINFWRCSSQRLSQICCCNANINHSLFFFFFPRLFLSWINEWVCTILHSTLLRITQSDSLELNYSRAWKIYITKYCVDVMIEWYFPLGKRMIKRGYSVDSIFQLESY